MAIRVMHVVNNLERGGLENGVVNLIERMDPRRFEHVVCAIRGLGANAERLPLDRAHVVCLADTGSNGRVQTPALVRAFRRFRPDVVHSRNWAGIEGVVAGRLARVRAVVHSEHGFETSGAATLPVRRIWLRRIAYELADRVLTVSFQLRTLLASRTGFPAGRIAVIHNGVDRSRFFPDAQVRARVRGELRIADAELCIGCVANLLPVKDHMTLLESLDALDREGRGWRLLLVGEGPEGQKLKAFVDRHAGWNDRVSFLGSSSRVPDLLRAMDVFVLPSVSEGISNSLLEAMATGLPVVAMAVGGNPEVVIHGESGMLLPPRDVRALSGELCRLRAQPDVRAHLGQGAMQRVRDEFSIESMVQGYERLYSELSPIAGVPALSAG